MGNCRLILYNGRSSSSRSGRRAKIVGICYITNNPPLWAECFIDLCQGIAARRCSAANINQDGDGSSSCPIRRRPGNWRVELYTFCVGVGQKRCERESEECEKEVNTYGYIEFQINPMTIMK